MKELSKQQIQKAESKVSSLADTADSFVVETAIDVENASRFLSKIKEAEKRIEAKRLEFTGPLNQSLKAINATFKNLKEPLAQAKKSVSDKILAWRAIEAEKVRKAEAEARKAEEEKIMKIQETCESTMDLEEKQEMIEEIMEEEKPEAIIKKPETTIGNTQARKIWTFEVTGFDKVPDKYKEISQSEVRAYIRDGGRKIPGIKIYQKEILSIV